MNARIYLKEYFPYKFSKEAQERKSVSRPVYKLGDEGNGKEREETEEEGEKRGGR